MSRLVEVGFANREENLKLLRKNGGDINKVQTYFFLMRHDANLCMFFACC